MVPDFWSQDGANLSPRAPARPMPPKLQVRQHRNAKVNNLSNALGRRRQLDDLDVAVGRAEGLDPLPRVGRQVGVRVVAAVRARSKVGVTALD